MTNNTYSLNKLQLFDDCPQKYKLCYIDKVHIIEPINKTKLGNNIHNLINYYFKGQDIKKLLETLTPQEKSLWDNFKISNITKQNCITTEYTFNVKLDTYWLTGRIDALFETNGKYIIVDWKTGENFTAENVKFQTTFYLHCLYEILFTKGLVKEPNDLSIEYINLATNNSTKIEFSQELYLQYKIQILNIINKINETTTFNGNKTDRCKFCKYYRVCPYI